MPLKRHLNKGYSDRMAMVKEISENIWEIPKTGKMRVPGRVFASKALMKNIREGRCIEQIQNVAQLPGIVGHSLGMPDAHFGYGFCVGGVAAFDAKKGIISPGGIGFDINCGVRLLASGLKKKDFMKKRQEIIEELYKAVPTGTGKSGEFVLDNKGLDSVLKEGIDWAIGRGFAFKQDKECCENNGRIESADPKMVSEKAKERGRSQLGTLGSGNHFLEIQCVESLFDAKTASAFGLEKDQIVVMIHSGSRGLGHQVASDYVQAMAKEYGANDLPDKQLACAPIDSKLGKAYLGAMAAAANFAFVSRQLITYKVRRVFGSYFPDSELKLVYDVAHNIAKFEEHTVDGKKQVLCVHRKGATRSFGPGEKELPARYRKTGQPIILPGSMGTFSYVLGGTEEAEQLSFSSTAHGAGRILSRTYALENITPAGVEKTLKARDVLIKAGSRKGMVEEAPEAYKDVDEVARVSHALGLGRLVARLRPLAVIKG